MIIDSIYTKTFISDSLSKCKLNEIKEFALYLNNHKNAVSNEFNNHLLYYLNLGAFDFMKQMRHKYKGVVSSNFDNQLYRDIYDLYHSKFEIIQKGITFEKQIFMGFEYYQKNINSHKRGDFKNVIIIRKKTNLSIILSYLARYANENIVEYIKNNIDNPDLDTSKLRLYDSVLYYVDKFGFDRLYRLALQKRNRIINKYTKTPIKFTKLTFRGRSRLIKNIISYNENYNSKIKAFINISWLRRGSKMVIPIKFNKNYHGLMCEYYKNTPNIEYRISIEKNRIKIRLTRYNKRYIPDNKTDYIGVDVNVKNNLFALSDGKCFDYNRKLIKDLSGELIKIDKLKSKKDYKTGKRRQNKLTSIKNKIKHSNEKICSDVCKYLNKSGYNHIVMENLDNSFGKSNRVDKNNNINYNRVSNCLNLSSLKNMMEHIAYNYDISISTVHPHYTSKACSVCGCIHDDNRQTQESFKCVECGYVNNADINAAINIKNRVASTVLRSSLLKQNKYGNNSYEPKLLKKEKVKEVLLSFRRNPMKNLDSENKITSYNYF